MSRASAPGTIGHEITATEVPALLKPGMKVFVTGSSNEPQGLIEAIQKSPQCAAGVTFYQFPLAALNHTDWCALHPTTQAVVFFMAPQLQSGYREGRVHFLPLGMRSVWDYLMNQRFDLVLTQVANNAEGQLCLGPNADFTEAAITAAGAVVAELNQSFIAAAGMPVQSASLLTWLLPSRFPLTEMPDLRVDETAGRIGRLVADLISDGDCIQTGIGGIPAAVLSALKDKNDLGLHSGLIDDGIMGLIQRGNLNGKAKTWDAGQHVTGMALGSAALQNWLASEPRVRFRCANYTHEIEVIRHIDNFVSINSALEVDLFGQVNAEFAGGRQISGSGGSVDFMRGARTSKGGRSILALTATAKGGTISRIVPQVALVTALRSDIDLVVTEFGVAQLRDAPLDERARLLTAIAAPQFRAELKKAWET